METTKGNYLGALWGYRIIASVLSGNGVTTDIEETLGREETGSGTNRITQT
jgi:hypothetical protein